MRDTIALAFARWTPATVALVAILCGGACPADEVVYVDDVHSPAAHSSGPQLPTLSRAQSRVYQSQLPQAALPRTSNVSHRGATRRQVAQALSSQAQQDTKQQQAKSGRFSLGLGKLFGKGDKKPSQAKSTPNQRYQPNNGNLMQAGFSAPRTGATSRKPSGNRRSANGGIAIRTGDRRQGIFDKVSRPQRTSSQRPQAYAGSTPRRQGFNKPSARKSSPNRVASRGPQAKPAANNGGAVFISDGTPMTPQANPGTAPRPLIVNTGPAIPNKPKFNSDPQPTTPTPTPLVIENPKAQLAQQPKTQKPSSNAKAEAGIDVSQAVVQAEVAVGPVEPQPVKASEATGMPLPMTQEAQPASVILPNPVAVAQEKPAEPSPRAAALLAEAHQMAQTAKSESDYGRVVQQCRHVLAIDDSPIVVQYSKDLASWALNKRGEMKADEGRQPEAMADFEESIRMDQGRWRAIHNRGVLHAQSGRFSEAFDAFNKTIQLNPKFAKAYSNRASLYVQAGEFEQAMSDYKQAIMLDPDLVVAHKGRGRVCHVAGDLEQALRHFEAAVLLEPTDPTIVTCRADLLMDMGRYAQAAGGYRQAIQLDPAHSTAYRNLAWLHATCPDKNYRDGQLALANAKKAIELTGDQDDISLDTLAAAHATTGDFQAAVKTIKQAIGLAPAADQREYTTRLELYEANKPFHTAPTGVRQAGYAEAND